MSLTTFYQKMTTFCNIQKQQIVVKKYIQYDKM